MLKHRSICKTEEYGSWNLYGQDGEMWPKLNAKMDSHVVGSHTQTILINCLMWRVTSNSLLYSYFHKKAIFVILLVTCMRVFLWSSQLQKYEPCKINNPMLGNQNHDLKKNSQASNMVMISNLSPKNSVVLG